MKKICFISIGDLDLMPYLSSYTKYIEGDYYSIFWQRSSQNNNIESRNTAYVYKRKFNNAFGKIFGYIGFRKFSKKILKNGHFDCVVILQTIAGIVLNDFLNKNYKNKFVVDVRDYSLEKNKLFYLIEKKLFFNAYSCVISSEGFKEFLPQQNYILCHNVRDLSLQDVSIIKDRKKKTDKLNIAYIGCVHYIEQFKKMIMSLKNDNRFIISFIGEGADNLTEFCKEHNINNVVIKPRFNPNEILSFYSDVNIINNLYGNNTPLLDYALSNKLYFAAELNIPILTCEHTFMSKISHEYGFGFDVDVNDKDCGDKIFGFYNSIDWDCFSRNCKNFMDKVHEEQIQFEKVMKDFLG